jgi:hypothetical protein
VAAGLSAVPALRVRVSRLLAVAAALEGMNREAAARLAGMDRRRCGTG